ncbi:hypothetical protein CY34DRAFT_554819 [Suillus luteus UH-Slu-Lm8-n1]|uniref:DUF6534 domain-containing protein n=1 Tax=Suillus luteus UH-Slu-Lm8-n1 TaxID=930992 RepID=A0A0D0BGH7_9AGAM|nr:hypothetical protein CY34DRAFT_554819 [Suillus luteus UH-Slu-Lm8-n1]
MTVYNFASGNMASLMTGLGISSIVFLILTAQVWIYFRKHIIRSRENRQSKLLVAFIWSMQAVQMAIITRISSIHTMEFEDPLRFMSHMLTEWSINAGICSLTTSLVHGVFIYRVFRLEKNLYGRLRMSFVLIAICVIEQVFGLLGAIYISKILHHDYSVIAVWSTLISLGCSAINDVLIAGTLTYILHKHRTISPRTNQMITKLIIFCSQTGLITTVVAFIAIGIWAACRFDIYHLHMSFPMGGLYATCLLANLIARESYLQPQAVHHDEEISEISFARFAQVIHVGLPDNNSEHQETLVMQGGKDSSKASLQV